MTPKTGAIRLATLRLFLPDGGCALSGLRSVRPAFNLASNPPVALPLTGATALHDLVARRRRNAPPGIISLLAGLDVRQVVLHKARRQNFPLHFGALFNKPAVARRKRCGSPPATVSSTSPSSTVACSVNG